MLNTYTFQKIHYYRSERNILFFKDVLMTDIVLFYIIIYTFYQKKIEYNKSDYCNLNILIPY